MKSIITFFVLIFSLPAFSQQWAWAKQMGVYCTMGHTAIKANSAGDLFVVSNLAFQTSHTTLSRVNPTGQITWSVSINGWNTALIDVSVDKFNNSYVLGWFASNLTFSDTTIWQGNDWELFIAAYAPNGHRKWVRTFPDQANWGNLITNDNNGDLIFAAGKNWVLTKLDQSGNVIWQNTYGCNSYINSLTTDHNNNIYLTGTFSNSLALNGNSYYSGSSNAYDEHGFICKTSPMGTIKDVQIIKGVTFSDFEVDSLNNYYGAGTYHDSLKIGQTMLTHTCASPYDPCAYNFIAKFDSVNNCAWIKEHNSSFNQIEVTEAGDCYISGTLVDTLSFNPVSISDPAHSGSAYIFKINNAGSGQWAVRDSTNLGSAGVIDMSGSANGFVFISGMYSGQPAFGSTTLPAKQSPYYAAALNENSTITSLTPVQKVFDHAGTLFPNPSKGKINLVLSQGAVISGVYDVFGNKIEKNIFSGGTEINLEENGKGIYFIELNNKGRKEYRKVIIE